ncbi:MFS transporter [Thermocrinis sp.]|uniref:MFS transporter n=1 Tax=Thermocrinis sp. TaxID=2024383 RepID=UPI002FDD0235
MKSWTLDRSYRFIFLMGLVSLFSDFTYEGGRSILGPYLAVLSASPLLIGFFSGFAEFTGYVMRLVSGYLSDILGKPWLFIYIGYTLNLLSVPAMALAPSWHYVGALMVLERIGKALRTPSRDAVLSQATGRVGHGKGFGLHEFIDQLGALTGPLFVASILYLTDSYRLAFISLSTTALLALITLALSKRYHVGEESIRNLADVEEDFKPGFIQYLLFSFLLGVSFVPFSLVAYHAKIELEFQDWEIPLMFGLAMLVDGVFALLFGYLFDRLGFKALTLGVLFTLTYPYFVFSESRGLFILGILLWGAQLGMQESIVRSAVAKLSPLSSRGKAYGLFHFFFGISVFLGGTLFGYFYQTKPELLILFSITAQLFSLVFLIRVQPTKR